MINYDQSKIFNIGLWIELYIFAGYCVGTYWEPKGEWEGTYTNYVF